MPHVLIVTSMNGAVAIAAVSHDLRTPLARLRLRADFLEDEVALSVEESRIVISVTDHGPGVPEQDLARITETFYRVDHSRSRQTGGAGLGLAIVKREVRRANGRLSFRNVQPSGLEVQVMLPREVSH
ncbi:MAG: ATP-binding protein [Acetobacteraceae bacterium]